MRGKIAASPSLFERRQPAATARKLTQRLRDLGFEVLITLLARCRTRSGVPYPDFQVSILSAEDPGRHDEVCSLGLHLALALWCVCDRSK